MKRLLRYSRECLDFPYEGLDGEKRLEKMAERENLILMPIRFVDKALGLPTIVEPPTVGFPGTLRDWLAGQAMQAFIQSSELAKLWASKNGTQNEYFQSWLKLAYSFSWWVADQMLLERDKK